MAKDIRFCADLLAAPPSAQTEEARDLADYPLLMAGLEKPAETHAWLKELVAGHRGPANAVLERFLCHLLDFRR